SLYTADRRVVRSRRDYAPLKLLTGIVKRHPMVVGCAGFAGSPAHRRVGTAMVPGLFEKGIGRKRNLDGEVLACRSRVEKQFFIRGGFGRDIGGRRFKVHR